MAIKEAETQGFTFGKYEGIKIVSLETYKQGKTLVMLCWVGDDPHYIVFAGRITNDGDGSYMLYSPHKCYGTEEEAKLAYNRQVAKVKRDHKEEER